MRVTARHLFEHALAEASIDRAFQRHVDCDRGVLRICEDLHDLDSYNRVLVISIGKAAHAMVNSLEMQAGNRFQGIVASSVDPVSQVRGFRYFRGGHPTPNQESIRGAEAILKSLRRPERVVTGDFHAQRRRVLDCGKADRRRNLAGRPDRHLPRAGASPVRRSPRSIPSASICPPSRAEGWRSQPPERSRCRCWSPTFPTTLPDALASGPTMPDSTSVADCYSVVEKYGMLDAVSSFRARAVSTSRPGRDSQVR